MRKLTAIGVAVAMLAMAGTAMAVDTAEVIVSASVTPMCTFNNGGTMSFSLDPSSSSNAIGSVSQQPEFWCTNGISFTITDDNGLNEIGTTHMLAHSDSSITDTIPYTFTYTAAGIGAGKDNPITMNIAGQIANADYVNVNAGTYGDTVTLTINP